MAKTPEEMELCCWKCGRRLFGEPTGEIAMIIRGKKEVEGKLPIRCQRCNSDNVFPRRPDILPATT